MLKSKKRRIAAKGWKVGAAKEFLGLSAREEAHVELRLKLSDELKTRRNSQRVTQT